MSFVVSTTTVVGRTPSTITADQTNVSASNAKTAPTSATASSNPPIMGPTKNPTLLIVLDATFAAVSSDGFLARLGSSAASAGRNVRPTTPTNTARTYTATAGPSATTIAAHATTSTARMTSAAIINRRRSTLSASTDRIEASTAIVR